MKKLALATLFFACLVSVNTQAKSSQTEQYTRIIETFESQILNETRTVTVQLPKSYNAQPNTHYPIIYRLDGAGNIPLINAVLEQLQAQRSAPEVIIVAIENTDRARDLFPTVNQNPAGPVGVGGGAKQFLNFITEELMPLIESKYRVHDFRVISGASAAGVFSLYALKQKPDVFNAALAYSAAVWWADGATAKSTVTFLKEKKALNHYLYTAIGNEGMPMRPYYDDMIAGIKAHKPKGLRWVNNAFSDVPHNLVSAAGIFNAYHNLFYSEYMQPKDFNGELSSIADYYSRLNAQRGSNFKAPEWVIRELGYHFVTKGDFEQAIKVFKYGISRYPNMPDAYNGLAYGYEQAGQLKASLVEVNKALKLAPKSHDGYQVYYNRQQRLLKQLSGS